MATGCEMARRRLHVVCVCDVGIVASPRSCNPPSSRQCVRILHGGRRSGRLPPPTCCRLARGEVRRSRARSHVSALTRRERCGLAVVSWAWGGSVMRGVLSMVGQRRRKTRLDVRRGGRPEVRQEVSRESSPARALGAEHLGRARRCMAAGSARCVRLAVGVGGPLGCAPALCVRGRHPRWPTRRRHRDRLLRRADQA